MHILKSPKDICLYGCGSSLAEISLIPWDFIACNGLLNFHYFRLAWCKHSIKAKHSTSTSKQVNLVAQWHIQKQKEE